MTRFRRTPTAQPRRNRLDHRSRTAVAVGAVAAVLVTAGLIGSAGRSPDQSPQGTKSAFEAKATSAASGAPALTATAATAGSIADSAGTARSTQKQVAPVTDPGRGTVEPKIIRTGSIEVEVARGKFDAASSRLTTIALGVRGFVSASEVSAIGNDPHGTITLRVPAARFDEVVTLVRKIGSVQAINTGSQDVTGEYTDVASRLTALQSEREQINLVLSRAETIPDILSVRDRLSAVQTEIEQLQGRQKVLDDQTSLSTLTVALAEKGSPAQTTTAPPADRTGFSKLWHDSTDRFTDGMRSIALGLATLAPWLLLGLVLLVPARALWRRTAPAA